MRKPDRKGLGRGLSALLGDVESIEAPVPATSSAAAGAAATPAPPPTAPTPEGERLTEVPIDLIDPNPEQPRRHFDEGELNDLAASIAARGIIQPVILRPNPTAQGRYQIVAGERRWRAAQRAQLHSLPVVIRALDDRDVLEIAIIENVQRADLNPMEEAQGYAQLIERFSYTQEALAKIVGKSRSHLANTIRLLALPAEIANHLQAGRLTAGHARALLTAAEPVKLAQEAITKGLTVRQLEDRARKAPEARAITARNRRKPTPEKDADTRLLEGDLSATIGMKVTIDHGPEGGGELRIRYKDLEDLDRLCAHLSGTGV